MSERVVFFVQHGSFEPAYLVATQAITAAAMGEAVYVVFSFDALRQLHRGTFGLPLSEREMAESARAEGLNLPLPMKLLEDARAMGAKLLACDTTVKLCGLTAEDLDQKLDEIMGLASLWRLTQGARTLNY